MIPFLRTLWWKLRGNRELAQKMDRLTLPQLNLIEARLYDTGLMTPSIESLFGTLREQKALFEHLREDKAR